MIIKESRIPRCQTKRKHSDILAWKLTNLESKIHSANEHVCEECK